MILKITSATFFAMLLIFAGMDLGRPSSCPENWGWRPLWSVAVIGVVWLLGYAVGRER